MGYLVQGYMKKELFFYIFFILVPNAAKPGQILYLIRYIQRNAFLY